LRKPSGFFVHTVVDDLVTVEPAVPLIARPQLDSVIYT
jgi:hypothetical protein